MTILHPNPIIEKLEEDGVETVKAKKAKGLYRDEKLPLINKWLAEKAAKEKSGRSGVTIHMGNKSTITLTGDPEEVMEGSQDPDEIKDVDPVTGLDAETWALANATDEEYKAADSKTKRKITIARKKEAAAMGQ